MTTWASTKKRVTVEGVGMAYVEMGSGRPIVFLHGNPTSSYLWRNVMPHVADLGRCIAPDLLGMGDSGRPADAGPDSYRFVDHRRYLDGFLDAVGVEDDAVLVGHDWGGALSFDWANRYRDRVAGIAYMETIVSPITWDDWPESARDVFRAMRSPAGETIVIEKNVFVERIIPASVQRDLAPEEMDEYRRPYVDGGETRRPMLTWPREIPIDGEPADVVEIAAACAEWLAGADVPKLFINAEPGSILTGRQRERCRGWPNQTEVTVSGLHFVQEDSADEIGRALATWLGALPAR